MDDPSATPDPKATDPATDTPPPELDDELDEEPAGDEADEPEADQSAAPNPIAQAEYTRVTQQNAAIRRALGLSKGATQAEIVAAIEAKGATEVPEDEDEDQEDPRLTAERQRRFEAELRVTSAVYGEEFTADGLALLNLARTSDDIDELMTGLAAFRDGHPAVAAPAPPAAAAAEDDDEAEDLEGDIDLSEGEASRLRESSPAGRRETGVVGSIRGLFEAAGIASRPPRA